MNKITINLGRLIAQATPQVFGSHERELLYQWLARNTTPQMVEIDLDEAQREDGGTCYPGDEDLDDEG